MGEITNKQTNKQTRTSQYYPPPIDNKQHKMKKKKNPAIPFLHSFIQPLFILLLTPSYNRLLYLLFLCLLFLCFFLLFLLPPTSYFLHTHPPFSSSHTPFPPTVPNTFTWNTWGRRASITCQIDYLVIILAAVNSNVATFCFFAFFLKLDSTKKCNKL